MEAGMVTEGELAALRLELVGTSRRRERPTWWHKAALCSGVPASVFYGTDTAEARLVCRACPVRLECLAHALTWPETFGVWAGLGPEELEELRSELGLEPARRRELRPEPETGGRAAAAVDAFGQAHAEVTRAQERIRALGERRRAALAGLLEMGWTATAVAEGHRALEGPGAATDRGAPGRVTERRSAPLVPRLVPSCLQCGGPAPQHRP